MESLDLQPAWAGLRAPYVGVPCDFTSLFEQELGE